MLLCNKHTSLALVSRVFEKGKMVCFVISWHSCSSALVLYITEPYGFLMNSFICHSISPASEALTDIESIPGSSKWTRPRANNLAGTQTCR